MLSMSVALIVDILTLSDKQPDDLQEMVVIFTLH